MIKGLGTLINIVTVLAGGSLGLALGSRFPAGMSKSVVGLFGLITLAIGVQMSLATKNILILIISMAVGLLIGEMLNIHGFFENMGKKLEQRFSKGTRGQFTRAFIATSVLFCVGPMTILGSIQDGLTGDYRLLATKSMLDGFTAIAFASSMGIGVLFSVLTIIVIQGGLTLGAGLVSGFFTSTVIAELTGAGGIMLLSTGLNILEIKKLKTANMLPALLLVPLVVILKERFFGGI